MIPPVFLVGDTPTLTSYPHTHTGEPLPGVASSPEVRVASPGVRWPDTYQAATADSYDENVDDEAREGERKIEVDPNGLVLGRRYLVVDVDAVFPITVEAVLADGLRTTVPLPRDVSAAARVVGWAVTYQLPATDLEAPGYAQAQFKADVSGLEVSWIAPFRVARRQPVIPLTPAELVEVYPDAVSLIARQDETQQQAILAAYHYVLMPRILRKGAMPEDVINAYVLAPALGVATMYHLHRQSRQSDEATVKRWELDLIAEVDRALARIDWHEGDQTESPAQTPDPSLRRDQIRLVR